jgi:tetratricopeptide (TPR) repeat protein
MSRVRIDNVRALLPELDELRPLMERILATSVPDATWRWSAAGELETVGSRLVRSGELERTLDLALESAIARLTHLYTLVARALRAFEADDPIGAADALLEIAALEEAAWRMERAEAWALAAHRAVEGERDRRPAALALRRAARAARGLGRLEDAAARYEASHALCCAMGDEGGAAVASIGRGNVDVDRGLWPGAEAWYRRAAGHLDRVADPSAAERWHVCLNLSIVARRRGRLEESRLWIERAETTFAGDAPRALAVEIENEWGMWSLASGDAVAAESRFRSALGAVERADSPIPATSRPGVRVTVAVNLGRALLEQGRRLEAAEAARDAEAEAIRAGVMTRLPEVYRLLGDVAAAGEHADAFVFYERALELIEREGLPRWERAQTLEGYARLRDREEREEEALACRREAAALREALAGDAEEGAEASGKEE